MNFKNFEFRTKEEGLKKLKEAVSKRNKICDASYFNLLNNDCKEIALRLNALGVEKEITANILNT